MDRGDGRYGRGATRLRPALARGDVPLEDRGADGVAALGRFRSHGVPPRWFATMLSSRSPLQLALAQSQQQADSTGPRETACANAVERLQHQRMGALALRHSWSRPCRGFRLRPCLATASLVSLTCLALSFMCDGPPLPQPSRSAAGTVDALASLSGHRSMRSVGSTARAGVAREPRRTRFAPTQRGRNCYRSDRQGLPRSREV